MQWMVAMVRGGYGASAHSRVEERKEYRVELACVIIHHHNMAERTVQDWAKTVMKNSANPNRRNAQVGRKGGSCPVWPQ